MTSILYSKHASHKPARLALLLGLLLGSAVALAASVLTDRKCTTVSMDATDCPTSNLRHVCVSANCVFIVLEPPSDVCVEAPNHTCEYSIQLQTPFRVRMYNTTCTYYWWKFPGNKCKCEQPPGEPSFEYFFSVACPL